MDFLNFCGPVIFGSSLCDTEQIQPNKCLSDVSEVLLQFCSVLSKTVFNTWNTVLDCCKF